MNGRGLLLGLALVVALTFPLTAEATNQGGAADQPFDLPAMTLTPADIEAIGLTGYGRVGNGEFRSLDTYVGRRADFLNLPEAELLSAFEDAGWRQGYVANLGLPAEPGNPESDPRNEAFSVVTEYDDPAGATAAYDLNRDYAGVTAGAVDVLDPSRQFADAAYLTRVVVSAPADDGPYDQVDLTLRLGRVVASTGVIDFAPADLATPDAARPEVIAQVEAMGARLLERIEAAIAGGSPALSNRTLRLDGEQVPIAFATEGYRRLNGDDPPYYNGYQDDFPGPGDAFSAVVAAYELNQGVQAAGDPYYVVRLLVFAGAGEAAAHLDAVRAAELSPAGTPAEVVDSAEALGDESWTIAYRAEFEPGQTIAGVAVHARSGASVVMLLWEGADAPDPAAVVALAAAQVTCLDAEDCPPAATTPLD